MTSSEVFSVRDNIWRPVGDMAEARFGHAIVKIGDRVLAVGGSKLHPDIMTDTVEEYQEASGWKLLEDLHENSQGELWLCSGSPLFVSRLHHITKEIKLDKDICSVEFHIYLSV